MTGWDLPYYDGALYFAAARLWPRASLLDRDWSPLYIATYSVFQKAIGSSDPWLVYASHRFLVLLICVLLFWRLAERLLSPAPAMVATLALLGNEGLLDSFHVVHAFALLYVLVALNVAAASDRWSIVLAALAIAGVAVRPEFLVAAMMLVPPVVYGWSRRRIALPSAGACGLAAVILVVAGSIWFSTAKGPGARAFIAFSQQSAAAVRDGEGGGARPEPFAHGERTRQIYGPVDSILGAMRANPVEFCLHIGRNLVALPRVLAEAATPMASHRVLACAFLLALSVSTLLEYRRGSGRALFWLGAGCFGVGTVATSLVFRPDVLYLLPAIPLMLLGGTWAVAGMGERYCRSVRGPLRGGAVALSAVLLVVSALTSGGPSERPVASFSDILRRNYPALIPKRVHAFSSVSYCVFSGQWSPEQCTGVEPDAQWGGSRRAFLEAKGVNVLIWGTQLERFWAWKSVSDGADLEEELRLLGFRPVRTLFGPFREETLYVRDGSSRDPGGGG